MVLGKVGSTLAAHKTGIIAGLAGGGAFIWWRRRVANSNNNIAGSTDPTVAGATQDQYGNQTFTQGTATDAGTTPMSLYDPYTSGYDNAGYNLVLGTGGIVAPGASNIPASNVSPISDLVGNSLPPGTAGGLQNPASPGVTPPSATVNVTYNQPAPTSVTITEPSSAQRDTVHRAIRQAAHNVKNGRPAHRVHQRQTINLTDENPRQVGKRIRPGTIIRG